MASLKKQIRLEKWKTTKDANGNNTEAIEVKYNFWAEVLRQGGSRGTTNGLTGLSNSMTFTIEYFPHVFPTGNWRVIYNGRRHKVTSIEKKDEDRFKWVISAESVGKR
jgi:SPP1 family predicted phage head-tail adaptor